MKLTDDLQKLVNLHEGGYLNDQEFIAAKARLLAAPNETTAEISPAKPGETATAPRLETKCYWSSRWSSGNLFFRDRLTLGADGITFRKGAMFGSSEEHVNYRAVASLRVANGIFLANITVETSGGSQPIFINGLWKSDAREIQDVIRIFQEKG